MFRFHRLTTVLFLISLGFSSVYADVTIDSENPLTVTPSSKPDGTITFDSGKLTVQGGETTLTNAVAVGGVNAIDSQARLILNGTLTGSGSITKTGGEQLHFGGDASGFSGTVTISSSWVNFRSTQGASASATYDLGSSGSGIVFTTVNSTATGANTFQLGMLKSTSTTAEVRVSSGMPSDATLQIGGTNTDGSFAGKFMDEGQGKKLNIEKVGTGLWTISNAQTFTGTTTLKNGTLCIAASYTSPITVDAGTLQLGKSGQGSTISSLTLSGGETKLLSSQVTIANATFNGGKLTGSNSVTLQNINLAAGTSSTVDATGYSYVTGNVTGSGTLKFDAKSNTGTQLHISGNANVSGKEFAGTIISQNGGYVAFRSTSSTSPKAKYQSTGNGNIVFLATETDKATFKLGELSSTGNCEIRSLLANKCRSMVLEVGALNTNAEFKGCIKDYVHNAEGNVGTDIYSVTKVGTGTWTLSANQEFTGPTNVNGGTLCINGNYKSPVYVNNGGTLTGVGTFLNGVEVKINAGGNLKRSMNQDVTLNGGTFAGTYNLTNVKLADGVTSYAVPSSKAYIKGKLSGTGTLSVNGSGNISNQLWLQGDNSSFTGTIISDKNSYVCLYGGKTSSASAKYQVTNSGPNKGNCGGFIFVSTTTDSGIYELGELSGGGEFRGGNDNKKEQITLKVGGLNTDATFSGFIYDCNAGITGSLSVEKVGTGSWTLTGKNEYTGSTTVSDGTLIIGEGGSITQTSSVTVKKGACLTVNGSLTSKGEITIEEGGAFGGVGTFNKPISFAKNATYSLNLDDSTVRSQILDGEPLELTSVPDVLTVDLIGDEVAMKAFEDEQGSEIVTFDALKVMGDKEFAAVLNNMTPGIYSLSTSPIAGGYLLTVTGSLNHNAVPEPTAWLLLLLGAGFLLRSGRSVSRWSSESF